MQREEQDCQVTGRRGGGRGARGPWGWHPSWRRVGRGAAAAAWALALAVTPRGVAAAASAVPQPAPGPCIAGTGIRDLLPGDWYYQSACAALAHGILHAVDRGEPDPPWLLPELRLNVGDWAHWLVRAFPGLPAGQRSPCSSSVGNSGAADLRAAAGLMEAFPGLTPGGRCAASDFVTRAEAVTSLVDALGCQQMRLPAPPRVVLARFAEMRGLPAPLARSLAIATDLQPPLLVGIPLAPSRSGQVRLALDPGGVLTRAQGVTLIYRVERIRPCISANGLGAASWHPWT